MTATATEKESEDETGTTTAIATVTRTTTAIETETVTATEHAARDPVHVHLTVDALVTLAPALPSTVPTVDATTEHLPPTLPGSVTDGTQWMTTTKTTKTRRKWCLTL